MSDSDQERQSSVFPGFSGVADDPGELIDLADEATNGQGHTAEKALALGIIDTIASRS